MGRRSSMNRLKRRLDGGPLEPQDIPPKFRRWMKRLAELRAKRKRDRGLKEPERTEWQGLLAIEQGIKLVRANGGKDIRLKP